jgi:bacterioferritin (cytochrome b1)
MDTILDQTGARWATLARDEQIALAQSVAGIRQYTQFMALMDNWDFMKDNLALTEKANGALTEQQRIYEEGTEAAQKRF